MKSKPNPDYFVYTDEDEREFIKSWKPYYQRKRFSHTAEPGCRYIGAQPMEYGWFPAYRRPEAKDHRLIAWIYKLGRAHGVLRMDYQQFAERLHPRDDYGQKYYGSRWRSHWCRRNRGRRHHTWYDCHGVGFREKIGLRVTAKKEVSADELQRREWKRKKSKYKRPRWSCGHKTWAKHYSNRCFRRYERREIQKGRYDNLFMSKRKDYFDPWDWD